jgi:hypothetical protein
MASCRPERLLVFRLAADDHVACVGEADPRAGVGLPRDSGIEVQRTTSDRFRKTPGMMFLGSKFGRLSGVTRPTGVRGPAAPQCAPWRARPQRRRWLVGLDAPKNHTAPGNCVLVITPPTDHGRTKPRVAPPPKSVTAGLVSSARHRNQLPLTLRWQCDA